MTETNAHSKKTAHETTSPFAGMNAYFQKEALRMADETEKTMERTLQEAKRSMHEGARVMEGQVELSQSMMRAWFDSARRIWNV